MAERRGKKTNQVKNYVSAKDFAEGKKIGRKKQVWVWDEPLSVPAGEQPTGHWEKA